MPNILGRLALIALVASPLLSAPAVAGEQTARRVVYNEATKSFFELRRIARGEVRSTWRHVNPHAQKFTYQGMTGRLAIIRNRATLDFINKHFGDYRGSMWIGGRYMCTGRKLVWNDGTVQKPSEGWLWWRQWYRHPLTTCPRVPYMPVTLRPFNGKFYWQATGDRKGFPAYLVEYRTGKR